MRLAFTVGPVANGEGNLNEPLRILVVDDNHDAADSLAVLLGLWRHTVEIAHCGVAGLEAARTFKPQAVLLDICMPTMHGGAVARKLREHPDWKAG